MQAVSHAHALTPLHTLPSPKMHTGAISQDIIEGNMRLLADCSRGVSLADLGYSDAGIDDGWQKCGSYGPNEYRYHDGAGAPVVDEGKFPSMTSLTELVRTNPVCWVILWRIFCVTADVFNGPCHG
jgi:hypothetical protein